MRIPWDAGACRALQLQAGFRASPSSRCHSRPLPSSFLSSFSFSSFFFFFLNRSEHLFSALHTTQERLQEGQSPFPLVW